MIMVPEPSQRPIAKIYAHEVALGIETRSGIGSVAPRHIPKPSTSSLDAPLERHHKAFVNSLRMMCCYHTDPIARSAAAKRIDDFLCREFYPHAESLRFSAVLDVKRMLIRTVGGFFSVEAGWCFEMASSLLVGMDLIMVNERSDMLHTTVESNGGHGI